MSLKLTFLAFKKVVQVVQIGGKGGGEVIQTKSKRRATDPIESGHGDHPAMQSTQKGFLLGVPS